MKRTLIFLACSLLLISCESKTPQPETKIAADFSCTISQPTRAHDSTWDPGDAIGIFMLDGQTALSTNSHYVTTAGDGAFLPSGADQTIYFPDQEDTKVDFIAYYPYKDTQTGYLYPIDITDQSDQDALILLTADKITGRDHTAPAISFTFRHRMTRLEFTIINGEGLTAEELEGIEITITELATKGNYDINKEAFTATDEKSTLPMLIDESGTLALATIIPAEKDADRKIGFSLMSGHQMYLELPDTTFGSGEKHLYTITLHRTATLISATITNWTIIKDEIEVI